MNINNVLLKIIPFKLWMKKTPPLPWKFDFFVKIKGKPWKFEQIKEKNLNKERGGGKLDPFPPCPKNG
jgi:hypothetical protein